MQGVGLGCATQSQSTPLSGDIDPHRTIHGIAQKRKLNGAICVALGVQEAIAGHHKGAWVQVVGHVADAAHPKIDRHFHFRSPLACRPEDHGPRIDGQGVSWIDKNLFRQHVQAIARPMLRSHTCAIVV